MAQATLHADRTGLPAAAGGTTVLSLNMGAAHGGETYVIVGSVSGARPGIRLPGGALLGLNFDTLTDIMLARANDPALFPGSSGKLDAAGRSVGKVIMPPGLLPPLVGRSMRYAAVTFPATLVPMHASSTVEIPLSR